MSACAANAGPTIQPGDLALRHDIQRLADFGVITGTVSTWPLAWGPILADIKAYETDVGLPTDVADAMARVLSKGAWETRAGEVMFNARLGVAEKSDPIRSFQNTPRDEAELSAGLSWIGDRLSLDLVATRVSNPVDDKEYRADGSQIAVAIGNTTLAAGALDRWWGPGWDSSLVLSNNARPIPAITLDRRFTNAAEIKWLRWLGPWDFNLMFGQLEKERAVPNTRFFGARFNFRPLPSLEIGLSRTAQWCGDGRPCDFDTFVDLLVGKDNRGDDNVTFENEPGNQTAGVDFRWSTSVLRQPVAFYGQFIGEDEAGGFPSRYIGQVGMEGTAFLMDAWSFRWYAEAALTTCDFWKSEKILDCAYNHRVYESGYRYRGRPIGHSVDNDAKVATIGAVLVDADETSWQALIRVGKLNHAGLADSANSLTPLPADITSIDLVNNRRFRYGRLEFGLGYSRIDGNTAIPSSNDARAFIQWRSN